MLATIFLILLAMRSITVSIWSPMEWVKSLRKAASSRGTEGSNMIHFFSAVLSSLAGVMQDLSLPLFGSLDWLAKSMNDKIEKQNYNKIFNQTDKANEPKSPSEVENLTSGFRLDNQIYETFHKFRIEVFLVCSPRNVFSQKRHPQSRLLKCSKSST
ncbi:hypothetical protein Csa_017838 [Cucumis sativus]|nr:hypothetical protein Csa_017838 [Cucumis sativus]